MVAEYDERYTAEMEDRYGAIDIPTPGALGRTISGSETEFRRSPGRGDSWRQP